ncbi:MAG: hypothetical protein Q8N81_08300 [bacterium]|nr:hypothetical protein [bacterium]
MDILKEIGEMMPTPFETPYSYIRRAGGLNRQGYYQLTNRMKKQGVVEVVEKAGKKFIKLTNKGQLRILMQKSRLPHAGDWDGKWRIVMFDIPEHARRKRDPLRWLLKTLKYCKLQESVS